MIDGASPSTIAPMLELALIYKWTILAGVVCASALSLIGAQLASRNQVVQTLVVSQAASFGVVVGMAIAALAGAGASSAGVNVLPLGFGLGFAAAFYLVCEYLVSHRWPSRNAYYVGLFVLLMALTHATVSAMPGLETHVAASHFGDLAVASPLETAIVAALGAAAFAFSLAYWPVATSQSFHATTFGSHLEARIRRRGRDAFAALSLLLIAACVQFLGLLFTLAALFLPSLILTRLTRGLSGLRARLVASAASGVLAGFALSFWQERIPTVSAIVFGLTVASLAAGALQKRRKHDQT